MTSVQSTVSIELPLPPSCIAFTPSKDFFVVGTYYLEKQDDSSQGELADQADDPPPAQSRRGSLILYQLDIDKDTIHHIETRDTESAILDIAFSPSDSILTVATSTGTIELYHLVCLPILTWTQIRTLRVADPTSLVLDLEWSHNVLAFTTSSPSECRLIRLHPEIRPGNTNVYSSKDFADQPPFVDLAALSAADHGLEPWTLSIAPSSEMPGSEAYDVWTGADDSSLRYNSIRSTDGVQFTESAEHSWIDRKTHTAGVTAILPIQGDVPFIVTGSYDDRLRVLSRPSNSRRTMVLAEKDLGGGVWRLKHVGTSRNSQVCGNTTYFILATCMHAGVRLVELSKTWKPECLQRRQGGPAKDSSLCSEEGPEISGDGERSPESSALSAEEFEWHIEVLAKFEEHKSMNYGTDIYPDDFQTKGGFWRFISTSFYDRKLCYWKYDLRSHAPLVERVPPKDP